jgi:periodic tryptophan protein 2
MNDINLIAFSPEGGQLASGADDGRIKIFDISSSNCLITFFDHTAKITGLEYALNKSNVLVSSSLDGTVRAYDLIKYKNFRIMTTPKQTQLICCSVDYSGEIVAAGSLDTYNIFVWSLKTGDLIDVLNGHTAPVSCLAFSHINDILISGSWDNTVKMWELYTKKGISETYEHNSKITAVALSPNDKEVAVSTLNGELYTWDIETGSIKNILDVSRDIWGGRLNEEKISAKNATRNKYLNTIHYNLPGNLLICGGNSQYVLIYDMQYQILVKKFVLTHNRSLNGLLYKLNSKYDNNKTLLQRENNGLDSEDELEFTNKQKSILPGNKSALVPEVKINSIKFSNTNRSFAVGTTEGVYIFSLDKSLSFSKLSIGIEVTLKDAIDAFMEGNYAKGIIYSLYLKKIDILDKYFDCIPISKVQLIADKMPFDLVSPLLDYLCNKLEKDVNVQYVMIWIHLLLKKNCRQLKNSKNKAVFLNLHKSLMKIFKGIENIVEDNIYTIKYLTEFEGNENEENKEKKEENKIDEE